MKNVLKQISYKKTDLVRKWPFDTDEPQKWTAQCILNEIKLYYK